ncbi:MAG: helix-hairpin-helix domain-containing protein, partial [bacterium]
MLDRFGVAAALREIATLLEAEGANPFKVRAYARGARALELLRDDLATLVKDERLTQVEGIGPALAATITELVRTGTTGQLAKLRQKLPAGVLELAPLLTVPKIQALQDTLGISTLADLEEACRAGRVRTVNGFGPKTEEKLLAAIDALRTKGDTLLLHQATQEADRLLEYLRESTAVAEAEIAGALRRRVEIVDRIELVVATADPLSVAEHVAAFPAATHVLEQDGSHAVVRLAAGARAEVTMTPAAAFPALLLHHTGSEAHLEGLAAHASAHGYALGALGLTR